MGRRVPLLLSAAVAAMTLLPGQLAPFGVGRFAVFFDSQTFTVPAGVIQMRMRCHGGGGRNDPGSVTGGSASVDALISATGGTGGNSATPGLGGAGFGGDLRAAGGAAGAGRASGGGAAGSELGNGGVGGPGSVDGATTGGGGGAVGGKTGGSGGLGNHGGGASPYEAGAYGAGGRDILGARATGSLNGSYISPGVADRPFPMFAFSGAGGDPNSFAASGGPGGGGGGGGVAGSGADGGGSGGSTAATAKESVYLPAAVAADSTNAASLIKTRGCGGMGGNNVSCGSGGGGYARGVFTVTPGQLLNITASDGALVILEW